MNPLSHAHRRTKDALLTTVLGTPTRLPDPASIDLDGFWDRFEAGAPLHLKLGLEAATIVLGWVLPAFLHPARPLTAQSAQERDATIQQLARLPLCAELIDVLKIVAALAYFSDPTVEDLARATLP